MGFFDFVADVYSSISTTEVYAEEQQNAGPQDKSGEQSSGKDARQGGMGTAQHDRGATTRGGVSTDSPVAGTDEESASEQGANAEDAEKAKSRTSGDGDSDAKTSDGSGAVPDTDGGEDDGAEEDEEEEEDDDDEPKDPKPRFEEECMKTSACYPLKHHYDECAERVQKQIDESGKPEEDCVEEYFHLMHCATQCASAKLFRTLR